MDGIYCKAFAISQHDLLEKCQRRMFEHSILFSRIPFISTWLSDFLFRSFKYSGHYVQSITDVF